MKVTNRLNLPMPLVRAIENDDYDGGGSDYTTTSLLKPPRMVQLSRQHSATLTEDASERVWSLFGQITHAIIERAATDELVEKRLFAEVSGKSVSGKFDLYQGDTLWDFKTTSIYSGKDGPKEEWVQQGNINRYLCAKNGIEVKRIQYVGLYRDWSVMKMHRSKEDTYPESQVEVFDLALWPLEKTLAFIEERIAAHEAAKSVLPECSDEERWARPEQWALMSVKPSRKRAIKLYDTEFQAESAKLNYEKDVAKKGKVEYRPGESLRCCHFCNVSAWCSQFRNLMMEAA